MPGVALARVAAWVPGVALARVAALVPWGGAKPPGKKQKARESLWAPVYRLACPALAADAAAPVVPR